MVFTVPGKPQGKGRPRFTRQGRIYTPKATADYEKTIRTVYRLIYGDSSFKDKPISLTVLAVFKIPKGTSKINKAKMLNGEIRPSVKPDFDNILKIIADALNGIAYDDDKQIVHSSIDKIYADKQGVIIIIEDCLPDVGKFDELINKSLQVLK